MKSISTLLCIALILTFNHVQARTFKIATLAPDGTNWMKEIRKGAKTISKRTDGRVKFKFYTGGVMGNEVSVLKKMRIGQLHGGAFTSTALTSVYQDSQIYNLPFLFRSYDEVDYVRKNMDGVLFKGLKDHGLVALGMSDGGFAYFMSDTPVHGVAELKDKKVWIPEGAEVIQVVYDISGISPVPLPMPDVYTGLQTGMIDTIGASTMGAIAFQWHTRIKFVTDTPLLYLLGMVVMDKKAFDKISTDDQKVVLEIMGKKMDKLGEINRKDDNAARQALQKQGVKFVHINSEEQMRWQKIADKSIKVLGDKGMYSPEMFNLLQKYLNQIRSSKNSSAANAN